MNDNDHPNLPSRSEAVGHKELPEWLQREADEARADQASERLWIGLGIMAVTAAAVFALNAWLGTQGYGA